MPFEVHPLGGLNHGLFTDMREHRRGLARFAAGARVLNLFSYTGALSVACARAGAATVTRVDTSAGVQAWAAGNFARSGLSDAKRWRFETGDAVRFLARAARDKERYDLVLIDPPTFSTARGAPWTLDRDYPELIAQGRRGDPAPTACCGSPRTRTSSARSPSSRTRACAPPAAPPRSSSRAACRPSTRRSPRSRTIATSRSACCASPSIGSVPTSGVSLVSVSCELHCPSN